MLIVALSTSAAMRPGIEWPAGPVSDAGALGLPAGTSLRRWSAGFETVLADWLWVRTLVYFGREAARQEQLDIHSMVLLPRYLDQVVELDPQHLSAWRFGAFFLVGSDPTLAERFAREAIRHNPDEWRLWHDLGYLRWRVGRYREAAAAYAEGARLPGSPSWMRSMAATLLARGGERETARQLLLETLAIADDAFTREACRHQLQQLDEGRP